MTPARFNFARDVVEAQDAGKPAVRFCDKRGGIRDLTFGEVAASDPDEIGSIWPSSEAGPNMKPHTTSNAASTNPERTWNAYGPTTGGSNFRKGRVQSSANTMVLTASQRHSLIRARPNAAAVTMAR